MSHKENKSHEEKASGFKKNDLILFSDEIHGDLTAEGVKHNTFLYEPEKRRRCRNTD